MLPLHVIGRAPVHPLSTLLVPIIYFFVRRSGRRPDAPCGLDISLGKPFLIDTAGNAYGLFDTIEWWDDFNHLLD
jgi:hypothetical protein